MPQPTVDAEARNAARAANALGAGPDSRPFEVWLVDQSTSRGLTYGGAIHIWDGSDLMGEAASAAQPTALIDMAGSTGALCMQTTGAYPVRPHMLALNSTQSHAVLSFVATGHVVVFDARTREPVACLRAQPGVGGARQAHAAIPSPDDSYILIANQNGKQLERIHSDYATNTYVHDAVATLNLATCTTPNGQPCESPALRPDNSPICPPIRRTSNFTAICSRCSASAS